MKSISPELLKLAMTPAEMERLKARGVWKLKDEINPHEIKRRKEIALATRRFVYGVKNGRPLRGAGIIRPSSRRRLG